MMEICADVVACLVDKKPRPAFVIVQLGLRFDRFQQGDQPKHDGMSRTTHVKSILLCSRSFLYRQQLFLKQCLHVRSSRFTHLTGED